VSTVYNPPHAVTTVEIPFRTIVQRADPDFMRAKKFEPYYFFSNGRAFYGDNATTGAYDGEN
jgi:hypothetical protein